MKNRNHIEMVLYMTSCKKHVWFLYAKAMYEQLYVLLTALEYRM